MIDVQRYPANVPIPVDKVGIRGLSVPLLVRDYGEGQEKAQQTVATAELSVQLPAKYKGTHMSRFVEVFQAWAEHSAVTDYSAVRKLLQTLCARLEAEQAQVILRFPFFAQKRAPATGRTSMLPVPCVITGSLKNMPDGTQQMEMRLGVAVPVMTVCPCSKAISNEGAHAQRAEVRMEVIQKGFVDIADLIDIAEQAGSSPVYSLLKRKDEKLVTERSFAKPMFVEDVVRAAAEKLAQLPAVAHYSVEVESMESIHAHNAFAYIEG